MRRKNNLKRTKAKPYLHLLGTTTDVEVARLSGLSSERIRQLREALEIPVYKNPNHLLAAKHAEEFGISAAAEKFGYSKWFVSYLCREFGIKAKRMGPKWVTPEVLAMLGKETDRKVSDMLGVSFGEVHRYRRALGIKSEFDISKRVHNHHRWTDEEVALLGTDTDLAIGRKIGLCFHAVFIKRKSLGIKAYKAKRSE